MSEKIIIFDTTLRDGEQTPGASMTIREKLDVARQLERLGVDVIEAGFPVISDGDFEAVHTIAGELQKPIIAGLARCVEKDIVAAGKAVEPAGKRARIHVFLATSKIHREHKLRKASDEILRIAVENVQLAKALCDDIEFSPEDASRTEPEFLAEVTQAVIEAGATTVNIPDTVGYAVPEEYAKLIAHLYANVPNINDAVISVHCHNDLGLAVANSLAAVKEGARQIECTINGLGERAGNASLEEIVMAMKTRADFFADFELGINTPEIIPTSRLVSQATGYLVQRNKAIVGANAFAHSSGIHQDGMIKNANTYEIMTPESVGRGATDLSLTKHSGRNALMTKVRQLGYELKDDEAARLFELFKELGDRKKSILEQDVRELVDEATQEPEHPWKLINFATNAGSDADQVAVLKLQHADQDKPKKISAIGDGPVDAVFKCVQKITGVNATLNNFDVRAVTGGKDAVGKCFLEIKDEDGNLIKGRGVSTDIVEASVRAYLNAINRLVQRK
ncbi:MAG: 2-isopropylmalate synthase [Verrucomicrobiales bacterium]|jgi:2-isopropylmalate synthase